MGFNIQGFRSYLDQGCFLGEHIQVIHLLLIPLYWIWPSQIMLELCESAILAAGCIPVYWLARRHSGDLCAARWLAAAYLLYFPMQFLDIGIDLKTFRPNGLGIPVLLFALDQLERRRYKTFLALAALALSAQEDFAIVLAPLGIWIALRQAGVVFSNIAARPESVEPNSAKRRQLILGACLTVFSVVYLVVATRVVMAWFRNWQEIHYASYFPKFGKSLPEIARTIATNPRLLADEFVTTQTALYALALLAPVGYLSLFSPGRLAAALPLFVTLCLNEVVPARDLPRHHVHAAAIPFIFWSAAAGLAAAPRLWNRVARARDSSDAAKPPAGNTRFCCWLARFACFSALVTGAVFGLSPLSIKFWDPY